MLPFTLARSSPAARVLVVSHRRRPAHLSRCTLHESEHLITQFDAADVLYPEKPEVNGLSIWKRRVLRRGYQWFGVHPQLRRAKSLVDREYDLVFVCCEDVGDLLGIGPIDAWIGAAKHKVCYVEEMWAADVPRRRHETVLLRRFDHVLLSCAGAVEPLARAIDRPVSFLAPSVDAVGFFPGDPP